MNMISPIKPGNADLHRRVQVFATLDQICRKLELTSAQYERAQHAYNGVARWLARSNNPLLAAVQVYPHGSFALGTTVKPIAREEYDVDLIAFAAKTPDNVPPSVLKKAFGDRLAEDTTYVKILEEKKRCWRLNYRGDFHLDISPTIANPSCSNGGELVPDRDLQAWHPTNPSAYRRLFEARANRVPRISRRRIAAMKDDKSIEPFPANLPIKGILRRIVQLLKRHRDEYFIRVEEEVAPISIIITTLAMRAYEHIVHMREFDDELEVLTETIRMMPQFVIQTVVNGRWHYVVQNETTEGENFADRWNSEPSRVEAFYRWHKEVLSDFELLRVAEGLDVVSRRMKRMLGERVVNEVFSEHTNAVSRARKNNKLWVAPAIGLSTTPVPSAARVTRNEFFGD